MCPNNVLFDSSNSIERILYYTHYSLENICQFNRTQNITMIIDLTTHIVTNTLNIYGIHHKYDEITKCIHISEINNDFKFYVAPVGSKSYFLINSLILIVLNSDNKYVAGMLLFLIDPLQAIKKLEHKMNDASVHPFFEYFISTITKQNADLILKYLLITSLTDQFIIADITYLIVSNIIQLLLL